MTPPGVYSGFVPPRDKIPKVILMFSRVSFLTVPMPTFTGDSFTLKSKMAPKHRK